MKSQQFTVPAPQATQHQPTADHHGDLDRRHLLGESASPPTSPDSYRDSALAEHAPEDESATADDFRAFLLSRLPRRHAPAGLAQKIRASLARA